MITGRDATLISSIRDSEIGGMRWRPGIGQGRQGGLSTEFAFSQRYATALGRSVISTGARLSLTPVTAYGDPR